MKKPKAPQPEKSIQEQKRDTMFKIINGKPKRYRVEKSHKDKPGMCVGLPG